MLNSIFKDEKMKTILVTGSHGQLGSEIQKISDHFSAFQYIYTDIEELDITDKKALEDFVIKNKAHFLVNCAAYTNVDKAEDEVDLCYKINAEAVKNIGEIAAEQHLKVVHISTDYVFDGKNFKPYVEEDLPSPVSVYGKSKLAGEEALLKNCQQAMIIRTSWLYSSFGNNFVKKMLSLGKERQELNVVFDQIGTPTYAADLARTILIILQQQSFQPGIYHFSNEGVCSWYDFAKAIFRIKNMECSIQPIESKEFPTKAQRPFYSVLNKAKIKKTFNICIPHWEESLEKCLSLLP